MELGLLSGILTMLIYINFNLCRIFDKISSPDNSNSQVSGGLPATGKTYTGRAGSQED